MRLDGILINGDGSRLNGSLAQLEQDLEYFRHCGFDGVELSSYGLDLVVGGRLHRRQVERVQAITRQHDLTYTLHAPDWLNLAFPQPVPDRPADLALEKDIFAACLEAAQALGARVMVYHSGLIALHGPAQGWEALPDTEALERARRQEVTALRELMPLAVERGIVVGMENRDPHPWEVTALMRAGLSRDHLLTYHAGMSIPEVVQQVEAVGSPNLGLTLDLGHLFLAANCCGFDYLEAIRQAAAHVRHLHGSDNFGRLGGAYEDIGACIAYGDRDCHLPPGWGAIPHEAALAQLPRYTGLYVIELRPRFREHCRETLETVQGMVQKTTFTV